VPITDKGVTESVTAKKALRPYFSLDKRELSCNFDIRNLSWSIGMGHRKIYQIFILALAVSLARVTSAQWEYGGKPIGLRSPSTSALAVAHIGEGNIVVAWDRIRGGDYDIYAQCLDSAGYELWGEGGMIVYEDEGIRQDYPAVLPDGEGGIFIVWSDWRHTPEEGIALYGQRLDGLGNHLWEPDGMRLTADTMSHEYATLYDDGHGGFVAVYRSRYDWDVNVGAQRVDGDGRILWDSAGIALTSADHDQSVPKTCMATDSTFITCWRDSRDMPNFRYDIYMQKFDLAGSIIWEPDGLPAVHWPHDQGYLYDGHDIVADGQGGAVVVWVDERTLYNSVLFADRFSPSGQSLWQENGMQLGSNLLYGAGSCQAFRIGDNFMFRWGGAGNGFRVSYLDANGGSIWDEPVTIDTSYVYRMFMEPEGIFKYLTAYIGEPFTYGAGMKVDTTGYRFWPDYPLIGRDILSESEHTATDGFGGMIMVWKASGSGYIKIAKIYEDGHVGGDSSTAVFEVAENKPEGIALFQNYPNPFNSTTTIRYRLEEKENIIIEIFDLLGRKILHDELADQIAGYHNYHLKMDRFPSGVYFVKLSADKGWSSAININLLK
jgi:hypothetical protein